MHLRLLVSIAAFLLSFNLMAQHPFSKFKGTKFIATDSVWTSASTPANPDLNAGIAVTVGTVFSSTTAGWITHVRFYKGNASTTTFTVAIWSIGGTSLKTGTFSAATTGWIRVALSSPLAIAANTSYVASMSNTAGLYSETNNIFNSGVTNGYITCPSQATSPISCNACGITTSNTFPNANFASNTCYWVQPVLSTR